MNQNDIPEHDEAVSRVIREELGVFFGVKRAVDIIIDWACHPEKYPPLSSQSPRIKRRRLDEKHLAQYFSKRP